MPTRLAIVEGAVHCERATLICEASGYMLRLETNILREYMYQRYYFVLSEEGALIFIDVPTRETDTAILPTNLGLSLIRAGAYCWLAVKGVV